MGRLWHRDVSGRWRGCVLSILLGQLLVLAMDTPARAEPGWTGVATIQAKEQFTTPTQTKLVEELSVWKFTGEAIVATNAGRPFQWTQTVSHSGSIEGKLERNDVCGGVYREDYKLHLGVTPAKGEARIIFGHPAPTPEPDPLPIEVVVDDPDPLRFETTVFCPPDPEFVQNSLRTPCRLTLGENRPFPTSADRYDTNTISYSYQTDPGGALCISSYTEAIVNVRLTRLPDDDCDGIANTADPVFDEPCFPRPPPEPDPIGPPVPPPTCKKTKAIGKASAAAVTRQRVYASTRVLKVRAKCARCKSVTATAPVLRGQKVIGRLRAQRTRVVHGRATLRFKISEKLFASIVQSLENKRATKAPLRVEGVDARGRKVRFEKATARFVSVVYETVGASSATRTAGARQSANACPPSPRYIAVSVPDAFAGTKG